MRSGANLLAARKIGLRTKLRRGGKRRNKLRRQPRKPSSNENSSKLRSSAWIRSGRTA